MKILLDTHIALWAIADTAKLSDKVIQMLETGENEIYYSMASVWEVAIKHKIKPEQMPMLLAQAKYEKLYLITHDSLMPYYREECVIGV